MVEKHLGIRFETLIEQLFQMEGLEVSRPDFRTQTRDLGCDFLIKSNSGKSAVVEIKLYRSRQASFSTILQIAAALEFARQNSNADVGILVIGNKIAAFNEVQFKDYFSKIVIYDIDAISFLVGKHFSLNAELEEIIKEAAIFSERPELRPRNVNIDADLLPKAPSGSYQARHSLTELMGSKEGSNICKELHEVPAGMVGAKKFEQVAEKALRYIFASDLTNWSKQNSTHDRISIFDMIARIYSKHDFWTTIVNQFSSRYIVFEFKNYSEKIKQGQIYTTEKYLYKTALRSTAIVISRVGADEHALAASRGALREHGKLIINLDIGQLCEMLALRDGNDDYNDVLVKVVDDMLMRLDR